MSLDGLHHPGPRLTAQRYVEDELRRTILDGTRLAGSRIRQNEVAKNLDVSTTPVREAIRSLASEGLIRLDSHRGAVVHEVDREELEEVYEMRQLLEPAAIQRAIKYITNDRLQYIESLHELMSDERDLVRWAELNREFHAATTRGVISDRFESVLRQLRDASALYVVLTLREQTGRLEQAHEEHAQLLRALRTRDSELAAQITVQHLNATSHAGWDALNEKED